MGNVEKRDQTINIDDLSEISTKKENVPNVSLEYNVSMNPNSNQSCDV